MEETNLQAEKYRKMTETPVERLVCRMAVPTIVSMLVTALYNMVDTWYVGFPVSYTHLLDGCAVYNKQHAHEGFWCQCCEAPRCSDGLSRIHIR